MRTWLAALAALTLAGCNRPAELPAATGDVTPTTLQAQAAVAQALPLAEQQAFDDAARGLIARPEGQILAEDGGPNVHSVSYGFQPVDDCGIVTLHVHCRRKCQQCSFALPAFVSCRRGQAVAPGARPRGPLRRAQAQRKARRQDGAVPL